MDEKRVTPAHLDYADYLIYSLVEGHTSPCGCQMSDNCLCGDFHCTDNHNNRQKQTKCPLVNTLIKMTPPLRTVLFLKR